MKTGSQRTGMSSAMINPAVQIHAHIRIHTPHVRSERDVKRGVPRNSVRKINLAAMYDATTPEMTTRRQ